MPLPYGHPFRGVRWFLRARVSDIPKGGQCWHVFLVTWWSSPEPILYTSVGSELQGENTTQFFTLSSDN